MEDKLIDVIIPAYNAHSTINRCLGSILQQTILDKVAVTIVNDAGESYEDIVNRFSRMMEIREITMEKNGGPGQARQYGIDNTGLPYFTCIDADDTFSGAFALQILLKKMLDVPNSSAIIGNFVEEQGIVNGTMQFLQHPQDTVWMFGKLYRRSFIEGYNIRFNETYANEDTGFNTIVKLCSDANAPLQFINEIVYYWHMKMDSITRSNNCEYSYNQSFVGFTDNMIYAIKEAKKKKPFNGNIDLHAVQVMVNLYIYYLQTCKRDPRFKEQNFKYAKKYYDEIFKDIECKLSVDAIEEVFAREYHMRAQDLMDIAPRFTFFDFLKVLSMDNCTYKSLEDKFIPCVEKINSDI